MTQLYDVVRGLQSEKRFNHTLGVISMAKYLADVYQQDSAKCELAGLLHDITKQIDCEVQSQLLEQINDQFIIDNPALWHGFTGAIYAQQYLKINDQEVLDAIKYHTTGKVGSTDLGMIIYLSDYLELNRPYPEIEKYRQMIGKTSLKQLFNIVAKHRIEYELSLGHTLHSITKELYESVI